MRGRSPGPRRCPLRVAGPRGRSGLTDRDRPTAPAMSAGAHEGFSGLVPRVSCVLSCRGTLSVSTCRRGHSVVLWASEARSGFPDRGDSSCCALPLKCFCFWWVFVFVFLNWKAVSVRTVNNPCLTAFITHVLPADPCLHLNLYSCSRCGCTSLYFYLVI